MKSSIFFVALSSSLSTAAPTASTQQSESVSADNAMGVAYFLIAVESYKDAPSVSKRDLPADAVAVRATEDVINSMKARIKSITGSTAGLATYSSLDITLGTDVGGSIRDLAVAHGIYGFRPSHNGFPAPDTMRPCPHVYALTFNTASVTDRARDLPHLGFLGRSSRTRLEFGRQWLAAPVDPTESRVLEPLARLSKVYREKFDSAPYVCKVTQWLWNRGQAMTSSRKHEASNEVTMHNEWLFQHILNDQSTIMIITRYKLDYRNEYLSAPQDRDLYGFDSNFHASFAGVPSIIFPVGQCPFYSQVTQRQEFFPVCLSIIEPEDKDIGLLSPVRDFLAGNGLPSSVLNGSTPFEPVHDTKRKP
ncbi:amidase-like protein [Hirsutella rhossiliensis]|uniref:Amidase-like protein n=1 Tax=Hirsutella rhossiliensis TaxID=111463 RepID=A0A9P8N532_9HYPO|nr:amidase-like protein [Hirsutella rhossiliensis]KAH0968618.1 amidase-like protein [Hirsutella rhossiliensis]